MIKIKNAFVTFLINVTKALREPRDKRCIWLTSTEGFRVSSEDQGAGVAPMTLTIFNGVSPHDLEHEAEFRT